MSCNHCASQHFKWITILTLDYGLPVLSSRARYCSLTALGVPSIVPVSEPQPALCHGNPVPLPRLLGAPRASPDFVPGNWPHRKAAWFQGVTAYSGHKSASTNSLAETRWKVWVPTFFFHSNSSLVGSQRLEVRLDAHLELSLIESKSITQLVTKFTSRSAEVWRLFWALVLWQI